MRELIKGLTKKDWGFLAIVSLLLALIIFAPTAYGLLITPPDQQFTGIKMPHAGDYWVLFSRLEQSRQGHLFHQYLYSGEPSPRVLLFPFWSMAGLTGKAIGLTAQQTFYFFEIILIPVLILGLYLLIGYFIKDRLWQKITLLAVLFTTGSDWLFWQIFKEKFGWYGLGLNLPEANVFTASHNSPHLIFILAGICWLFICLFLLESSKKIRYSWLAGGLCFLIFLTHPYQIIPLLGIIGGYFFIAAVINKKRWLWLKSYPLLLLIIISGAYLFLLWHNFEFIRAWNINDRVGGYHGYNSAVFLISNFGLFLFFAVYKMVLIIKEKRIKEYLFLLVWLGVRLVAIFLPIQWRGKMILSLSIPIIILGGLGLMRFLKNKTYFFKVVAFWLIITLTLPGGLYLIGYNIYLYQTNSRSINSEYYFSKELIDGFKWLKNIPADAVILPVPHYGLIVPAYSGRKVYLGSPHETLNYPQKLEQAVKYFKGEIDREFIIDNKIDYIFTDSLFKSFNREYLSPVYSNPEVKIYKVIR